MREQGADPVVERFVADLAEDRARLVREIHRVIGETAPDLLPAAGDATTVGYGPFDYRYASGRRGSSYLISMRNGSTSVSVYVNAVRGDRYLPELHAEQLGRVQVGRSCVRIRRAEHLDLAGFGEVVREAVAVGGAGRVDPE